MILKEIKKIESSPPAKTLLTLFFFFLYEDLHVTLLIHNTGGPGNEL